MPHHSPAKPLKFQVANYNCQVLNLLALQKKYNKVKQSKISNIQRQTLKDLDGKTKILELTWNSISPELLTILQQGLNVFSFINFESTN